MSQPSPKRHPIPFGKYLLLDRINIGGMAEVWRGKSFGAGGFERLVAIKRILPNIAEDEEFRAMFIDEAKISVQLSHANIAQIYELGNIGSSFFIAMEYIAGRDLRAVFDRARRKKEPLSLPLVCHVISKVCEGLDHAHRKRDGAGRELNIVHRDVSPQNVLLSYDGEVKVIDFGIAKAAGKATKTQAGILKGKFGYMSPEQIVGRPVDRRTDIFAIGVCLHELLTGERLFVGDSDFSVLDKVRRVEVRPPSELNRQVPPELERIVFKALTREVEDRYAYASDMAEDLQRFLITSGHYFGRKDLMDFMRSAFAEDLQKEQVRLQEYADIELTPQLRELLGAVPGPTPAQDRTPAFGLPNLPPPEPAATAAPAPGPVAAAAPPEEVTGATTLMPGLTPAADADADADPGTVLDLAPLTGVEPAAAKAPPPARPRREDTVTDNIPTLPVPEAVPRFEEAASRRGPAPSQPVRRATATGLPRAGHRPPAGARTGELPLRSPPVAAAPSNPEAPPSSPRAEAPVRPLPTRETPAPVAPPLLSPTRRLPWGLTARDVRVGAVVGGALFLLGLGTGLLARPGPKGLLWVEVPAEAQARARVRVGEDTWTPGGAWPLRVQVELGTQEVEVTAAGYLPFRQTVVLEEEGEVEVVQASLQPLVPPAK